MKLDVQPDGSIRIYRVGWKLWAALLGAIAFVSAGLWLIGLHERPAILHYYHALVGVVAILFFGLCAVAIVARIFMPSPAVVLSREGITDAAFPCGVGLLCWDEVAFLSVYSIQGQPMLGLYPKDPRAFMARIGWAKANLMKLNLRMGFAPVNISQVDLPVSVDELAELIRTRYGFEARRAA